MHKKTAPSIPGTVLQEPYSLSQKPAGLKPKVLKSITVAVAQDLQRAGIVKAHHADEALAIDQLHIVAHQHLKRLDGCHGNKFLHILKRVYGNAEFLHKLPPDAVQSRKNRV